MAEDNGDPGKKASEQKLDGETLPKRADIVIKAQSGRPPARPPYQQYLRMSKTLK